MHIVGLTGGIGAGKSMAAVFFKELGVPVVDLDDIARQITQKNNEGYEKIVNKYGARFLNDNKEINRYLIKKVLFSDQNFKKEFESIIHPLIYTACLNEIDNYRCNNYLVLVVPLLFESSSYLGLINESLLIDCDKSIQKNRVSQRDHIDSELIENIIANQLDRTERQLKADKIILNDGLPEELKKEIKIFHNDVLKKLSK